MAIDKESTDRLHEKLRRALGSTICAALNDPTITEIMVNPDGSIRLDRLAVGITNTGKKLAPENIIDSLGTVARLLDAEINKSNPILEGELPIDNGSRIEGIIPPASSGPLFSIRKKASRVFPLSDYIEKGKLSQMHHDRIVSALMDKKNILVSGGTGSGKTTFCNALLLKLSELLPNERVIIMEDTAELQCPIEDNVPLHTVDVAEITLNKLLRATMRLRPDRIIVGEVRGGEALDLLKSWNTGHPGGFGTIHANSAAAALTRLEQLIARKFRSSLSTYKFLKWSNRFSYSHMTLNHFQINRNILILCAVF
ncbi:MAG: P-type conjugative transfer ATPase TrbB [Synergistaceae bacterium]|nr:P-type conjugative transfer ATPase TrbB [Synergistaceae bacterium]